MADRPQFPGQDRDEDVIFKERRHWFILLKWVVPPGVLFLAAAGIGLALGFILRLNNAFLWAGLILLLSIGPLGLTTWRFLDWENDRYILTNQRVLHFERVYFLFESRKEANLGKIQDVTVKIPTVIAKTLQFGDVVIETAGTTGQIKFEAVPRPRSVQRRIFKEAGLPVAGMSKVEEWEDEWMRGPWYIEIVARILSPGRPEAVRLPAYRDWGQVATLIESSSTVPDNHVEHLATHLAKVVSASPPQPKVSSSLTRCYMLDVARSVGQLRLPKELPLIFLLSNRLAEDELESIRQLTTVRDELSGQVALLVMFCPVGTMERARKLLHQRLGAPYAFDIVPLGKDDFMNLVYASDPHRSLRRLLLEHVDLVTMSPFVTRGPALDRMFFGREKELREVTEHAITASYSFIGGRRVGKTSVLARLHRDRLPGAGFRAYYYQCQRLPETEPTRQQFLKAVADEWLPEPRGLTPSSFAEILSQLSGEKPLVALIDEVDRLVPADLTDGWPLFGELRALSEARRCQFVFAGERTLREAMKDGKSPLFNFANAMFIGCLDRPAVEELITRTMKQLEIDLTDESAIVQRIWDATSGHPNVAQRLCQRLILRLNERRDRRLTPDDIEAVVADPTFQRDDFYDVFLEQATVLERIMPLVLAQDGNETHTLSDVRRLLDERLNLIGPTGEMPRAEEVDAALRRLVGLRSILDYTPQGYAFAVKAFPQVIIHWGQVTAEDELMILTEKYRDYGDLTEDEIEQKEGDR